MICVFHRPIWCHILEFISLSPLMHQWSHPKRLTTSNWASPISQRCASNHIIKWSNVIHVEENIWWVLNLLKELIPSKDFVVILDYCNIVHILPWGNCGYISLNFYLFNERFVSKKLFGAMNIGGRRGQFSYMSCDVTKGIPLYSDRILNFTSHILNVWNASTYEVKGFWGQVGKN